jgi:hypothetical protein
MNKTEEVLSYVVLVLFVCVLIVVSIISYNLIKIHFHPNTLHEEVILYIPTVIFCFFLVILFFNALIYVLGKLSDNGEEK